MENVNIAHSITSLDTFSVSPSDDISYNIEDENHHIPIDMISSSELSQSHDNTADHASTPQSRPTHSDVQHNVHHEGDSPFRTGEVAAELLALRYPRYPESQQHQVSMVMDISRPENSNMPLPSNHQDYDEAIFDNQLFDSSHGIFLPGSAYRELHTTLRNHIIHTAKSNAPTTYGTPERQPNIGFFSQDAAIPQGDGLACDIPLSDSEPHKPPELTAYREYTLWKNYIDELAPWVSAVSKLTFLILCL